MPLADMQYAEGSTHAPPVGGVRIFPPGTVSPASFSSPPITSSWISSLPFGFFFGSLWFLFFRATRL